MSNLINQQKDSAETLSKMIDLLGLSAEQECNFDDRCIVLNLRSEDPGRLIGRNGQTIDALQTLINKMLRRHEDDFPRIVIDVDGYKKTRRTRRNKKENDSTETHHNQDQTETNERPKRERPKRRERNHDNTDENRKPKAKQERPKEQKPEPRQERNNNERKPEPRQERNNNERKPEPRQERNNNERKPERRENSPRPERRENNNRPESGRSKLSDDRTEAIKKQAIEASKEAKRWGEKVTLPPMSSSERRLIHLTLQDDPAIVTESGADMPNGKKRVIVRSK